MKFICIAAMALLFLSCNRKMAAHRNPSISSSYTDAHGNPVLLGLHTKEDLQQAPYGDWFHKNYSAYQIDSATADQLKPLLKNKKFTIFLGTWCGDSKREVPKMFKLLEYAGVQPSQITMIMVDNRDSMYKQSPGHEEKGKFIHRVPDLIVYEGNNEMNRIVENPVVSLEKDLLAIVQAQAYEPNYKGAAWLLKLTETNHTAALLKDSTQLLATIKELAPRSAELNSLGYVWMAAGENEKAMLAFQVNAMLFPNEANVYDSLGEINWKLNNKEAAKKYYRRVLEIQPANANALKMLAALK